MKEPDLIDYYTRRALEYERIYHKPERQEDLGTLRLLVAEQLADREVLEIACGTGYWTEVIAPAARSVVATDASEAVMDVARHKTYPEGGSGSRPPTPSTRPPSTAGSPPCSRDSSGRTCRGRNWRLSCEDGARDSDRNGECCLLTTATWGGAAHRSSGVMPTATRIRCGSSMMGRSIE